MDSIQQNPGTGSGAKQPEGSPQLLRQVQIFTRLVAGIFLIAGLLAMGAGAYLAWVQLDKNRIWPEVKGTVSRSRLVGEAGGDSGPLYKVWVEFHYSAGGKDYVGNTGDGWSSNDRSILMAELRRYPDRSVHMIRYNPADPTQVQIETELTAGSFTPAMVAGGIGLCVVVVSLFGLVSRVTREPLTEAPPPGSA